MAGKTGAEITTLAGVPVHGFLFGEDQARYVLATSRPERGSRRRRKGRRARLALGRVEGDQLTLTGVSAISVAELLQLNEAWLPTYMAG